MTGPKDKSKIEVIRIGLEGIDIETELQEVREKELPKIDLSGLKSKKPKVDPIEAIVKAVASKLISIADTDKFMSKNDVVALTNISPDQFGRVIQRVQTYLRREDVWALQKIKKGDVVYYYVIKFGGSSS